MKSTSSHQNTTVRTEKIAKHVLINLIKAFKEKLKKILIAYHHETPERE